MKSYTLTGLKHSTKYDIKVSAGNAAGETVSTYAFITAANGKIDQEKNLGNL